MEEKGTKQFMVARTFYEKKTNVQHILADGSLQSHDVLNHRLLELYFPDRYQISFFTSENKSDEEYLEEAYRNQNRKIGYHMDAAQLMAATV